jgi:hypothetical protein
MTPKWPHEKERVVSTQDVWDRRSRILPLTLLLPLLSFSDLGLLFLDRPGRTLIPFARSALQLHLPWAGEPLSPLWLSTSHQLLLPALQRPCFLGPSLWIMVPSFVGKEPEFSAIYGAKQIFNQD